MAWTTFTDDGMDKVAQQLFRPLILLVNYTLLQYLMVFYWARRREPRVMLLFAVGLLGVVCIVPFANPNTDLTGGLNDVSESCSLITFLLQITIIGRDLNRKIKFKTVLVLTWIAEVLVFADLLMVGFSLMAVLKPDILDERHASLKDDLPNAFENINLAYVFFFRFYYIIQSRGLREIRDKRKLEVTLYLLFATHEAPFLILEDASGLSWEAPQAIWHRLTLAGCLYVTATAKLRDTRASVNASRVESGGGSPTKIHSRSSTGRFKRVSTTRRGSNNVYVVATVAMASTARTVSFDHMSTTTMRRELAE